MSRASVVAILLAVSWSAIATAQEFDVFDTNDFLDPRIRGLVLVPSAPADAVSGDSPFLVTKVSMGRVSDYYYRTAPTGADVTVTHVATSYYRGRHQFNMKLTDFSSYGGNPTDPVTLPKNSATLQWAVYDADVVSALPGSGVPEKSSSPEVILNRYLFSLSTEEGAFAHGRNYEMGSEIDIRIPKTDVLGTLSYVLRKTPDGISERFAYVYRIGQEGFKRLNVDGSVGYVAEKAGHWQWGNIRPAIHARVALDRLSTSIHVAYAPTISVIGGLRVRHEAAVFVDYTLIAHVFHRVPPVPMNH